MERQQKNVHMGGAAAVLPRQAGKQFSAYNFKYYDCRCSDLCGKVRRREKRAYGMTWRNTVKLKRVICSQALQGQPPVWLSLNVANRSQNRIM